jgi:hypothetical protein
MQTAVSNRMLHRYYRKKSFYKNRDYFRLLMEKYGFKTNIAKVRGFGNVEKIKHDYH